MPYSYQWIPQVPTVPRLPNTMYPIDVVDMPMLPTDHGLRLRNVVSPGWVWIPSKGYCEKQIPSLGDPMYSRQATTSYTYSVAPPVAPAIARLTVTSPLTNVPAAPVTLYTDATTYPLLTKRNYLSTVSVFKKYVTPDLAVPLQAFEIQFGDAYGDSTATMYPMPKATNQAPILKVGVGFNSISVFSNRIAYYVGSTPTIKGMTEILKGTIIGVAFSVSAAGVASVSIYRNGVLQYARGGIQLSTVPSTGEKYLGFSIGAPPGIQRPDGSGYMYTFKTGSTYYLDSNQRIVSRPTAVTFLSSYGNGCITFAEAQNTFVYEGE